MEKNEFNSIGIDGRLDWARIKKLFSIGLFAAILTLIADMMLGWGIQDESLSGIPRMFSAYRQSDAVCSCRAWDAWNYFGRPVLFWNLPADGREIPEACV